MQISNKTSNKIFLKKINSLGRSFYDKNIQYIYVGAIGPFQREMIFIYIENVPSWRVKVCSRRYSNAFPVCVSPSLNSIPSMAFFSSSRSEYWFSLKAPMTGVLKITIPNCTAFGPMANSSTMLLVKFFIRSKFSTPTLPLESNRNTMSAAPFSAQSPYKWCWKD